MDFLQAQIEWVVDSLPASALLRAYWCQYKDHVPLLGECYHLAVIMVLWTCYLLVDRRLHNVVQLRVKIQLGLWLAVVKKPLIAVLCHNLVALPLNLSAAPVYFFLSVAFMPYAVVTCHYADLFAICLCLLLLCLANHAPRIQRTANQLFLCVSRSFISTPASLSAQILTLLWHLITVLWSLIDGNSVICQSKTVLTGHVEVLTEDISDNSVVVLYRHSIQTENNINYVSTTIQYVSILTIMILSLIRKFMFN